MLTARGDKEAKEMALILQALKERITEKQKEVETGQLKFAFDREEKRQLEADRRHWKDRLRDIEREIESEPKRIVSSYEVQARRIEPVGLVYLWPVSS